jgi:exodeoxyribonuclease VII small subunit
MTTKMTDALSTPPDEPILYKDALLELEKILDQIEGDEVDLDELASKVERAATLLQLCRGRIAQTEQQVRRIIEDLDEDASAP